VSALLRDRVLALVPPQGSILTDELWRRGTKELGLVGRALGGAIAELCTERVIATERRGGHSFVRRVSTAAAVDFPLVRRPSAPPRRPTARRAAR
jgi:hypothetical protein